MKLKHEGTHTNRLHPDADNPRERMFAAKWKELNEAGTTLLWLLGDGTRPAHEVAQRDATVAATVVQWLGSNVGSAFLCDVIDACPELRKTIEHRCKMRSKK